MYCVNCGVRLGESEKKCPLCDTLVYHPNFKDRQIKPMYPQGLMPNVKGRSKAFNGALIILFFIPLLVTFLADLNFDNRLEWFWFVGFALLLAYVTFALPLWFKKPNPVIFVPCDFAAAALYLMYIDFATKGGWFLGFALPVTVGFCIIVCSVLTLLYYLKKGVLYILGGAIVATGAFMPIVELLLSRTFKLDFIGWSFYPLAVTILLGGLMIYLAINRSAREIMQRKLFI